MRDDLNHMLSETRKTRQDTVNQLFQTFQHARNELALDLREASFAWHAFAAGRDEPAAPKAKPTAKRLTRAQVAATTTHAKPSHKAREGGRAGQRETGTRSRQPGRRSPGRNRAGANDRTDLAGAVCRWLPTRAALGSIDK